jgi:hypothetical protein
MPCRKKRGLIFFLNGPLKKVVEPRPGSAGRGRGSGLCVSRPPINLKTLDDSSKIKLKSTTTSIYL